MLSTLVLIGTLLFTQTHAYLGEDMTEEEFQLYAMVHNEFRRQYGNVFVGGAIMGFIKGAKGGIGAMAMDAALSGAAAVAGKIYYESTDPQLKKKVERLVPILYSEQINQIIAREKEVEIMRNEHRKKWERESQGGVPCELCGGPITPQYYNYNSGSTMSVGLSWGNSGSNREKEKRMQFNGR